VRLQHQALIEVARARAREKGRELESDADNAAAAAVAAAAAEGTRRVLFLCGMDFGPAGLFVVSSLVRRSFSVP